MKKILKKIFVPIFLSLFCGTLCGKTIYSIYAKKITSDFIGEKIYLIQAGAYSTYDSMVSNTSAKNYVYYEDTDGLFKSIIGITENYNNIEKIKSTYKDEVIVSEYYLLDSTLSKKISEYDQKIASTDNVDEIKTLVLEMLELYKDKK